MDMGSVKVLMVRGANPYYGLPDVIKFKQRIENLDLIVSFSNMMDDTTAETIQRLFRTQIRGMESTPV